MIDEVMERLQRRFKQIAPDQISATVQLAHARFEHSKVRDFVPLFVERRATERLSGQSHISAPSIEQPA